MVPADQFERAAILLQGANIEKPFEPKSFKTRLVELAPILAIPAFFLVAITIRLVGMLLKG